jgi:hypothetical protein
VVIINGYMFVGDRGKVPCGSKVGLLRCGMLRKVSQSQERNVTAARVSISQVERLICSCSCQQRNLLHERRAEDLHAPR